MTNQTYESIINSLDNKELKQAFNLLQSAINQMELYALSDTLTEIQSTYINMLRYRMQGIEDPMQTQIYHQIITSLYAMTDKLRQDKLTADSSILYYSQKRTLNLRKTTLISAQKELAMHKGINRKGYEEAISLLFNIVWTHEAFNPNDTETLHQIIAENSETDTIACQVASALTLGLQEAFDIEKLLFLFSLVHSSSSEVRIRALIGIVITLYNYKNRITYYPQISTQLDLIKSISTIDSLLETISLRMIIAMETEKITQKMQTEILPEMMKMNPKLNKKINLDDVSMEQLSEGMNPEWRDKLDQSPLGKKLMEMGELQKEGADLMHSSFIHLKFFPFFREISNWFLPFSKEHSAVAAYLKNNSEASAIDIMASSSAMCNSDKFSLYLSMASFPNRKNIEEQFDEEATEMLKQKKAELETHKTKETELIGQYIQDLYRFYKLFASHKDFQDIFATDASYHCFHSLSIFNSYLANTGGLSNIAELYLQKGYYKEALDIYETQTENAEYLAITFQKIGYCRQMIQRYTEALEAYQHADILNPDNKWLLKHMALCYRSLKETQKALEYYLRYETLAPENLSNTLSIGHCYLELKNYAEALKYYFKVDYLKPSGKTWRAIAWCSFLAKRFDQAQSYYEKICEHSPKANDWLNAGHTQWAIHNAKEAQKCYLACLNMMDNDFNAFAKLFYQDKEDLMNAGITSDELPLMIDELQYTIERGNEL